MNKTVKEEKVRDEKSCNFYDLKTMRERERERERERDWYPWKSS